MVIYSDKGRYSAGMASLTHAKKSVLTTEQKK